MRRIDCECDNHRVEKELDTSAIDVGGGSLRVSMYKKENGFWKFLVGFFENLSSDTSDNIPKCEDCRTKKFDGRTPRRVGNMV